MNPSFENIISSSSAVLIDFYAEWCAPCKLVVPVIDEVGVHFGNRLKIHKVDIDNNSEISKSYAILSVPTLILFRDGKEIWRMRGFDTAPGLIKIISSYLK